MKYLDKKHFENLEEGKFLTGITQKEYSKYLNLPYEEGNEDYTYKAKIAVAITTTTEVLTTDNICIKEYDIVDILCEDNLKYEILMKSLADNIMDEFSVLPQTLLSSAFPIALGVLLLDDTVYYVFNLQVIKTIFMDVVTTESKYAWVHNKNFTFNEKLDTIIVPKLKFL